MKSKEITKKIVGGKYKHMSISLPATEGTRSTKSIMKESLFDSLQFDIVGEDFVEVFEKVQNEGIAPGEKEFEKLKHDLFRLRYGSFPHFFKLQLLSRLQKQQK